MSKHNDGFNPELNRRRFKGVVSTALVEKGHLLMVQEADGTDRGRWNFPGGKVGEDEWLLDAALREMREETGCTVKISGLGGLYHYVSRSGEPCLRFLFFATAVSGTPRPRANEIEDVRWFHLDQLEAMEDREICKPQLLRPMFAAVRRMRPWPIEFLHELVTVTAG
jgi:8-oxo-dGTP pyrophosphatase MutT (NUDIX family)